MSLILKGLIGALFLAYPFIIYYGLIHFSLWQIALLVSILAGLRAFIFKNHQSQMAKVGFYSALSLVGFSLLSLTLNQNGWIRLYPIIINIMFFMVFFKSLSTEKTIIQNFAEIKEKNITAKKQKYMRKLTVVWCGFFIINASISAYTLIYLNIKQWTIYNGFISYILIGTLIVSELLYRHLFVIKKDD